MESLKQEAIRVISALPESATIEEIMYETCNNKMDTLRSHSYWLLFIT
jgi:hypothetical protein